MTERDRDVDVVVIGMGPGGEHVAITFRHVPSRRIRSACQGIQGGMPAGASGLMPRCPEIPTDTDGAVS